MIGWTWSSYSCWVGSMNVNDLFHFEKTPEGIVCLDKKVSLCVLGASSEPCERVVKYDRR